MRPKPDQSVQCVDKNVAMKNLLCAPVSIDTPMFNVHHILKVAVSVF